MKLLLLTALFLNCFLLQGQVFVQLELFNDPSAKKYTIGDKITYRMNYSEKDWYKGTIKEILIAENTLILSNDIVAINDISDFMLYRQSINVFSGLLQAFGSVYVIQGALGSLAGRGNVNLLNVVSVGAGSYLFGWIFRKLFYKIPVHLGTKNRLRIVDLRFSIDP